VTRLAAPRSPVEALLAVHDRAPHRQRAILLAAEDLFRQRGPQKTTISEIARAARVAVGSVYLEFPSKNAILGALSERRYAGLIEALEAAWRGPGSAEERLRRALDTRFERFARAHGEGAHALDFFHCGDCAPIEQTRRRYIHREEALFAGFLAEGAREGAFRLPDDPGASARALLRCYASFAPPFLGTEPIEGLVPELGRVHAVVLAGLRATPLPPPG